MILQTETSNTSARIKPTIQNIRIPAFITNDLFTILDNQFGLFVVLPLIVIYLQVVRSILKEKENKTREAMRIMGMSDVSFYLSWIIYYLLISIVVSVLCAIIMKASVFSHSNWALMFVWHWLFCVSVVMQAFCLTTFFSNVKLGSVISMVFYVAMIVVNFIVAGQGIDTAGLTASSIISQNAVSFGANTLLQPESYGQGINWSNIND
jgi:ATP-binding cassette subfamily A (ABC1) protein 3